MQCPRCQHENPPQAKFCLECGARLALKCAKCRTELPGGAKFCLECGEALGSPAGGQTRAPESYTPKHLAERILTSKAALEGERKHVTVLFADLKGSMELLADRDPEEARKLLDPVLERMMEAVHRYEGTVNQVMGDGIMALFGAPLAHEDHAVRACYAALDMQAAIRRYAEEARRAHGINPQIRVGLNSGEVVVRAIGSDLHMDYTAVGQTTHLAARMEQFAGPGAIVLTADTLRLAEGYIAVKPLGPVPIKGLDAPVEVYERLLERAIAQCRESNVTQYTPPVMASLGHVYAWSGRIGEGISWLQQALTAHESGGIGWFHSISVMQLGEAYLLADQVEDARACADRAVMLARERGERGHEAWALRLWGEVACHPNGPDEARAQAHYGAAMALASELGMRPLVAHCHLGLGKFYGRTGDREKVGEHLATAATMYREMDMRFYLAQAEAALGGPT